MYIWENFRFDSFARLENFSQLINTVARLLMNLDNIAWQIDNPRFGNFGFRIK